ncbi:MAG TPA: hypothetical protein VI636_21535 [Candidatus Angelobacter sp.]
MLLVALPCIPLAGCGSSTIDTVLQDLPIAVDIAASVINIVSPGNAELTKEVTEYAGKVSGDLKLIESLISQYKANLATAPSGVLGQINTALNDAQNNLSAILQAVGVGDAKVTAAVAAAIGSVKLIISDVAIVVKNSAPPAITAKVFFGLGMPGVDFMAVVQPQGPSGSSPKAKPPRNDASSKPSGKSARQIAKEYNQKISKDFPNAKVNVPKMKVVGVPVPMTGGK